MDYLAKINIAGHTYEAHVDVREYDGELEAEFSTSLVYVDDRVHGMDDVSSAVTIQCNQDPKYVPNTAA